MNYHKAVGRPPFHLDNPNLWRLHRTWTMAPDLVVTANDEVDKRRMVALSSKLSLERPCTSGAARICFRHTRLQSATPVSQLQLHSTISHNVRRPWSVFQCPHSSMKCALSEPFHCGRRLYADFRGSMWYYNQDAGAPSLDRADARIWVNCSYTC